ncbi:uncharacterized protein PV06_05882 [Exophiala oligosperma]|uniref:Uncharacterized protein n=1 Tax=Exophiala oligosperma TaxID=215243 RepID=A0A0D2DIN8_9EURO|nr:uncharacterized protein PV06_05882 [Exophiala oligosperma]KIW42320.1 hypothetical protein PV06_05882 [Exophiala oligosperma]
MTLSRPQQNHDDRPRSKMLLSSRANPPKPLKVEGASRYLSIKSFLPETPIPSPSLPSILPRHGKKPPKLNSRKIVRLLIYLSILIGIYCLFAPSKQKIRDLADLTFLTSLGKTYEIIEAAELPEHPTPLALTDHDGKHHWTIWIPQRLTFPLPATDYADICSQVEDVARHVAGLPQSEDDIGSYYDADPHYIDVVEAQARHFLPEQIVSSPLPGEHRMPVCEKTLTYVLDATDAGLGSALLGMWVSYSLAGREGREFFIDDTHFPYGRYSTFFAEKPTPKCRPPPTNQRVPCPHQAKHLVISAATTAWTFGDAFHNHYSDREIYEMAREGYDALFKLNADDEEYVSSRARQLRRGEKGDEENGLVGLQIRRGDCHPFEFAYQQGYLPPERYMASARKLVGQALDRWKLILASDDADMFDHVELTGAIRAQTRISLASKRQLGSGGLGWEGGFFKDVFWGLGLPEHVKEQKRVGSPRPTKARPGDDKSVSAGDNKKITKHHATGGDDRRDYKTNPTQEALQLRELLGRAYLLDLAVLARSDKVICGVSSNACRVLAVMMGWGRAFDEQDWNNVDGNHGWRFLDY